jgi:hypothetical protein
LGGAPEVFSCNNDVLEQDPRHHCAPLIFERAGFIFTPHQKRKRGRRI